MARMEENNENYYRQGKAYFISKAYNVMYCFLKEEDGKIKKKLLKEKLLKILDQNNFVVDDNEFDESFIKYSNSTSFELIDGKYLSCKVAQDKKKKTVSKSNKWKWENKIVEFLSKVQYELVCFSNETLYFFISKTRKKENSKESKKL